MKSFIVLMDWYLYTHTHTLCRVILKTEGCCIGLRSGDWWGHGRISNFFAFLSTEFSPIHLIHPGKWPGSTGSHWKHDYGKVWIPFPFVLYSSHLSTISLSGPHLSKGCLSQNRAGSFWWFLVKPNLGFLFLNAISGAHLFCKPFVFTFTKHLLTLATSTTRLTWEDVVRKKNTLISKQ